MPVSPFFNTTTSRPEQNLAEDLMVEAIRQYGIDVYYLPRTILGANGITNDFETAIYSSAYVTEVYLKSIDNFEGDGAFMAKFHLEVRDQITFTIANRAFEKNIGLFTGFVRPREGDLVYVPMIGAVYYIKYGDKAPMPYYQFGKLKAYDLTCELFEYSNEYFSTGIKDIDDQYNAKSTDLTDKFVLTENDILLTTEFGEPLIIENEFVLEDVDAGASNEVIEEKGIELIDFTERNPFSLPEY